MIFVDSHSEDFPNHQVIYSNTHLHLFYSSFLMGQNGGKKANRLISKHKKASRKTAQGIDFTGGEEENVTNTLNRTL
ncbi:hypothetical protein [Sporomusa malonica]|uniref:hypothetical protein n=1 Tax=Sporomusa malonica TaxID=112901 RepID=UPI00111BD5E7|nr:hypothetical protein [Sporomusa malonica]